MVCRWTKLCCWCFIKRLPSNRWITNKLNSIFNTPTGTIWFANQSTSQRNRFLADQLAAESAQKGAVVKATNEKQALTWNRFEHYLQSIGIHDPFLSSFTREQQHKILGAFCQAIREGRFNSRQNQPCKSESVRAALDNVAQTYRLANKPDPRLNTDGKLAFILQCQLRGYQNIGPPSNQQVAITGSIIREFYRLAGVSNRQNPLWIIHRCIFLCHALL